MRIRPFSSVSQAEVIRLQREGKLKGQPAWRHLLGDVFFECTKSDFGQRLHHVWVCDDNGNPLYDTFIHHEPIGAVTLPISVDGKIGLQLIDRPVFKTGAEQTFPTLDYAKLGDKVWEIPRGAPQKGEAAKKAALREADEELGKKILRVKLIAYWRANSTFFPHNIPVFMALVDPNAPGECSPDENEKILKVEWFDEAQVMEKILAQEISCGATMTALAWYFAKRLKEEKAKSGSSAQGAGQSSKGEGTLGATLGVLAGLASLNDGRGDE